MKSDMAHMTAVSTSSHRNPRCILRELRQASEGGLTEALRESDGAGRKPQLPKKSAPNLAASSLYACICTGIRLGDVDVNINTL